tara:strand:- start:33106 stop:33744 length:639 start_codon:yes stop_codon:yes gene_type:complete
MSDSDTTKEGWSHKVIVEALESQMPVVHEQYRIYLESLKKELMETKDYDPLFVLDSIRTSTGLYVDFKNLSEDVIDIEDIAHSLSMQCRFGGHLPEFYSVAQHSVECSWRVSPENALEALLHDASEAYMLDIPKPLKNLLPDYEKIEYNLMIVIANKYGFNYPLLKEIKTVDAEMLRVEFDSVMLKKGGLACWSQKSAKSAFLDRYYEIMER